MPASYVQIIETFQADQVEEQIDSSAQEAEGSYTAVALYDFDAQNDQELSFKAGDIITLTDYTDEVCTC